MRMAATRLLLWVTALPRQRLIIGVLLLALTWPTYQTYDFRGSDLMAAVCFGAGVCAVALWKVAPDATITDRRDTFIGLGVTVAFMIRLVAFVGNDIRTVDGSLLSVSTQRELYEGASAPIIHLLLIFVGLVLAARPIRNRQREV